MKHVWTVRLSLLIALLCGAGCKLDGARGAGSEQSVRVMSYNIKHGRGMDGVVDLSRAAEVIRRADADLVALQEVDEACGRSGAIDEAAWLADELGLNYAFGAFMDYDGGRYGMALLSRFPLSEVTNHRLPGGTEPRTALSAVATLPGGQELVLVGIHLYATDEERLAQATRIVQVFEGEHRPVVLAGDFNSEPGTAVMSLLEREYDNPDKGPDHLTFDSVAPDREIDYILLRAGSGLRPMNYRVMDEPLASDHRPLVMELRMP